MRSWPVLALAAALVLAGCSGLGPDTVTPTHRPAPGTPTETPTATPTPPAPLNETRVVERTRRVYREAASFRGGTRYKFPSTGNLQTGETASSVLVARFRLNRTSQRARSNTSLRSGDAAFGAVRFTDGNVTYEQGTTGRSQDPRTYDVNRTGFNQSTPGAVAGLLLTAERTAWIRALDWNATGTTGPDGNRTLLAGRVADATALADSFLQASNVATVSGAMTVDDTGLARRIQVTVGMAAGAGSLGRYTLVYTTGGVGTTTVEAPAWYENGQPRAANETSGGALF